MNGNRYQNEKKKKIIRHSLLYSALLLALLVIGILFHFNNITKPITDTHWGLNIRSYSKMIANLSARLHRRIDRDLKQSPKSYKTEKPLLSITSSSTEGYQNLSVQNLENFSAVHYSVDGSVPTRKHPKFNNSILIQNTSVIRAKAFDSAGHGSDITNVSIVDRIVPNIPIVSIVIDPIYLYNKYAGIYANPYERGRAWERPANVFFHTSGDGGDVSADALVRIQGGFSRKALRKNFRLYIDPLDADVRTLFGDQKINISSTQTDWVLKVNSHPPQLYRNIFGRQLARQMGLVVGSDVPCLLYVNGQFWGVYDLMERTNDHFLRSKAGDGNFVIMGGSLISPKFRSKPKNFPESESWKEFISYVANNDLSKDENFQVVEKSLDIESFIDYMIFTIFIADIDRPQNNIDIFKKDIPNARWRFFVWDLDQGLNYGGKFIEHDTLAYYLRDKPNEELKLTGLPDSAELVDSTILLRKLMQNSTFKALFADRFRFFLESVLSSSQLETSFREFLSERANMEFLVRKRYEGITWTNYDREVDHIFKFIKHRPKVVEALLHKHVINQ